MYEGVRGTDFVEGGVGVAIPTMLAICRTPTRIELRKIEK